MNGNHLKLSIKKKGLTQEKAANILGVSRQTLNSWCKQIYLSEEIIENVKTLLDIDLEADEAEMLKKYDETLDNSTKDYILTNSFTGLTDEEIKDVMREEFDAYLLAQFEAGRIVPAVTARQYQDQIQELTAKVARLEYINQDLTLKLQTPGETERVRRKKGDAEQKKSL